jgi:hypothetical protein
MKRISVVIYLLVVLFLITPANAELIDRGFNLIYDTDLNITWLKDANYAKTSGYDDDGIMTWDEAMKWAEHLVYESYDDWRLPTALNHDGTGPCLYHGCTNSELGHLFYIEMSENPVFFINLGPYSFWTSTEQIPNDAWVFITDGWSQRTANKMLLEGITLPNWTTIHAWPVRDGDVNTVRIIIYRHFKLVIIAIVVVSAFTINRYRKNKKKPSKPF